MSNGDDPLSGQGHWSDVSATARRKGHADGGPRGFASPSELYALGAVLAMAAVARFAMIGRDPFWMDEAASWWFATRPLRELWTIVPLYEAHPPLYYTFLRGWRWLFGDSESNLRSFAAVASLAVVPLTYLIGRVTLPERAGRWLGLCAAAFIALHPMQVRYAQEARSYALLTTCVALMLLGILWFARSPHIFEAWWKSERGRARSVFAGILVSVAAAMAFWMHQTAPLLVGLVVAAAGTVMIVQLRGSWRSFATLSVLGSLIFLLWVRDVPWMLAGASMIQEGFWIPRPDFASLVELSDALFGLYGITAAGPARWVALLLALTVAALGAWKIARQGNGRAALLLTTTMCAPVLLAFVASRAIAPIFIPRILIWTEVPFAVLAAASLLGLPRSIPKNGVAIAVCIALATVVAMRLAMPVKEDWRRVAQILKLESTSDDLIVVVTPYAEVPLLYYGLPAGSSARWLPLPASFPGLPDGHGIPTGFRLLTKVDAPTLQQVRSLAQRSRRVWYAIRSTTSYDENSEILKAIEASHPHAIQRVRFDDLLLLTELRVN